MKRQHAIATHEKLLSHARGNRPFSPSQRELFYRTSRVIADLGFEAEENPDRRLEASATEAGTPEAGSTGGTPVAPEKAGEEEPSLPARTRTSLPPGAGERGKGKGKGK